MDNQRVNFPEVLFFQEGPGVRNTQYTNEGVKLLNVANLVDGSIDLSTSDRYISTSEAFGKYKHFLCDEGDFIVASSGIKVEYIDKKMGFVTKEMLPLCMNTSTIRFKALNKNILNIRYFMYFLKSNDFKQQLSRHITGSAQLNYGPSHLKIMTMPLVSIEKQATIVNRLDKTANLLQIRNKQLQKFDNLIKARFVEMFGDLKANTNGWKVRSFLEFAKIDTVMIHDFSNYKHYPHIGIDSIEKDTGIIKGYRTVEEDGIVSGKYLFTDKHIIYSKIRPNLNKVAMPDFTGVCSADAYPILANENICNREFLTYVMRSNLFLDYILKFSSRTNLPKVNKEQVEGFACPIPSISIQKQFSSFVHQIDKSKAVVQQSLDKTQLLFDSLMQQYFG